MHENFVENQKRTFNLGDVLSIITGKLLSPSGMQGVYGILNYMTGETLYTHQLPRAMEACSPILKRAFPTLAEESPQVQGQRELDEYLAKASLIHGNSFAVPRLSKNDYTPMNALAELAQMTRDKR